MLFLQTIVATLIATGFALPTPAESTRDLISLNVAPTINAKLLNNLLNNICAGIATCNPVTVTEYNK